MTVIGLAIGASVVPWGLILKLVPLSLFEGLAINEEPMTEDDAATSTLSVIKHSQSFRASKSLRGSKVDPQ